MSWVYKPLMLLVSRCSQINILNDQPVCSSNLISNSLMTVLLWPIFEALVTIGDVSFLHLSVLFFVLSYILLVLITIALHTGFFV
jgi:hypothetical protein